MFWFLPDDTDDMERVDHIDSPWLHKVSFIEEIIHFIKLTVGELFGTC